MSLLTIKDNSQINKEQFSDVKGITSVVADKTLEQLEREGIFVFPALVRDAEDITRDQMILQSVNDCYCSGNVMGYLGCGSERLVIKSRFGDEENDYFFRYLLEKVLEYPNVLELDTSAQEDSRLFHLMIFLFPYYLQSAMRKGLFKQYIRRDYNDDNVKGTIDIARHIEKNTPFRGNIAYCRREFSYDNYLMELIRHTIEHIRRKSYANNLLGRVKDEVRLVVEATPEYEYYDRRKVIDENKKSIVRHAYYREYLALQRLCIMILQHRKHRIGSGDRQVYGILFDGAWLWEEYINSLIGDYFHHPKNKAGKGAQRLFSDSIGLIYPDYISRDSRTRIIADAKYKPIENIGSKDYLQVLAYMFRFDAKQGYYFYPESNDMQGRCLWLNRGSTYENNVEPRDDVSLKKHGLNIPCNAKDYDHFVQMMIVEEKEFKRPFESSSEIDQNVSHFN